MEKLNNDNYFSKENEMIYCGNSQLKNFIKCEAQAIAKITGEWEEEKSTALLVGSYVDSYYEGSLEKFQEENPDIFKRDGTLKSEYKKAEEIIERLERDKFFSKYMAGEKQVIMEGIICEQLFKIKIDSFHKDKAIVDLKIMKDMQPVWVEGEGKKPFVEAYGYDIQGAIYQEIVRQNTGKKLPFFLAVGTKEATTDLAILAINQERLDFVMENIIKPAIPRIKAIKEGKEEPTRCGHCDYCKSTKILTKIIDYTNL